MTDDIPFNRTLDLAPGVVEEVVPAVRRILVDNRSPFTWLRAADNPYLRVTAG